jgi:membrane protein
MKDTISRLERGRGVLRETVATLRNWPWFETIRTLRERIREDRLGLTASSLTFTTLISLVPLVTVMLAVFTAFPMFGNFQVGLEKYFLQSLVPPTIAKPVLGALTMFASKASRLGSAGLVALVITAMALVLTIDRTLNSIWRVRKLRPIGQRVLIYWAALTFGPLVLGASMTFTSYAISASSGLVRQLPGGVSFMLGFAEFVTMAVASAALFHYVPHAPVRWRHAIAGGLFVASGVEVAKKGVGLYVAAMPTYSSIYGAFATVPILLLWIYVSWLIVLMGAVIAAYAPSLQMRMVSHGNRPGQPFALALEIVRRLREAQATEVRGFSSLDIASRLRIDPLQIESALETLVAMDWVGRLDEDDFGRYVLLCDPARTPLEPLVDTMLLAPIEALSAARDKMRVSEIKLSDVLSSV